ncbi:MAG: dephospho-CoA kinase [Proteobacteria bacterium]|nr:MAG: dephospho-CoA kinase [Pseudomonadota bacterium]
MTQLVVVLTGGIASGKTQVSDTFNELGSAVIDADIVAREVVAKDTPAWHAIHQHFGQEILLGTGDINRAALRKIVFNDGKALAELNAITHPVISQTIKSAVVKATTDIILVVIPLLTVANRHAYFDRVLVVDVGEDVQRHRLQQRDEISAEYAQSMLNTQINREQRLMLADDVINNDGSIQELISCTELMHGFYQSLVS